MTTPPHPLVAAAGRLAAEVLAPRAERVDQEGVPAAGHRGGQAVGTARGERAGGLRRVGRARRGGPGDR